MKKIQTQKAKWHVTLCYEMVRTAKSQRQNRGVGGGGAEAANPHRVSFGGEGARYWLGLHSYERTQTILLCTLNE